VKGKSVPLELFELQHKFSPENIRETASNYNKAFALYQDGKFSEAESRFQSLSRFDNPSAVLAQRCAEFAIHAPQDWRGVVALTTK
jgi:hypothetical protein